MGVELVKEIRIEPQPGPQTKFLISDADIIIFGGSAGGGKLMEGCTPVLTPFGYKKNEDLKIGDKINSPDGTVSEIIQIHPWKREPGVRVHFHDGTSTVVGWEHLWLSWNSGRVKKKPGGVKVFGESAATVCTTTKLRENLDRAIDQESRGKRPNWPCIPVCKPQVFNVQSPHPILLDPYKLGAWLGDGHIIKHSDRSWGVGFTTADHEHAAEYFPEMNRDGGRISYRLKGDERLHWVEQLGRADLLGKKANNKFIPRQYLYGSIEDRWAMLQGLMDTDGTVDSRGQLYYCTVSKQLSEDVVHIVQTLGGTATVFEKDPFYRDEDGEKVHCQLAYSIYIKLHDEKKAFRLPRKIARTKSDGNMYRRVVEIEELEEKEMRCITVSHPSGLYMTNDCIVTHNSYALLMDAMRFCVAPPTKGYGALLLRKSFTQIEQTGGLKSASEEIYPYAGAKWNQTRMRWTFPIGATVGFGHLEHEADKQKYQGAEIPWIGFDELTHFSESSFFYLMSRNRSTTGVPSRIRASCNPDSSSWVAKLIEWWINQDTGFPIPERDGVIRWFVRTDGGIVTSDTYESLWEIVKDFYQGNRKLYHPKTLTFIRSKLEDNTVLMEKDPGYIGSLMQLPAADRQRLYDGNWMVSTKGGSEWEEFPEYFGPHIWTNDWPEKFSASVIFIDPSKGEAARSDPTAIVFVGLKGGKIYVRSVIRRMPGESIVREALDMYLELRPTALAIESNKNQFELLSPMFDRECECRRLPPISIKALHNHESKQLRIKKLGPYLENEKLVLQRDCEGNRILYQQLKDFGIKGTHDDGPDALEGAIQILFDLGINPMDDAVDTPSEIEEDTEFEYYE